METELVIKDWRIREKDDKTRTITGTYDVRLGGKKIASQEFNAQYGGVDIAIPAAIMAKVEEIDAEVKAAILDSYTK